MGTHEPAAAMGATAWRMMLPPRGRFAATAAAADAAVDNVTAAAVVVVAVAVVLYCTGSTFVVFHIGSKGAHVALLRHAALAALIPAPPRPGAGLAAKRSLPLHGGHHHLRGLEASEAARGCRRRRRRRRRPSLRVALCSLVERRAAQVVHADHAAHVMRVGHLRPWRPAREVQQRAGDLVRRRVRRVAWQPHAHAHVHAREPHDAHCLDRHHWRRGHHWVERLLRGQEVVVARGGGARGTRARNNVWRASHARRLCLRPAD
mmetsp:Transcript_2564/g.6119  ORF Transcript_2564/g.6119 Transcript_2564/m.6119 type:complete len:262 (-) Transcript_2564:292-1077(-)